MPSLALQRCFNHTLREAVARCPECGQFYCRECITEHEDRVICATCLRRTTQAGEQRRIRLAWVPSFAACLFGFVVLWLVFYYCGVVLLQIPPKFHEGTVWADRWI